MGTLQLTVGATKTVLKLYKVYSLADRFKIIKRSTNFEHYNLVEKATYITKNFIWDGWGKSRFPKLAYYLVFGARYVRNSDYPDLIDASE